MDRKEGSSKVCRPLTPTEQKGKEPKASPNKRKEVGSQGSALGSSQGSGPRPSPEVPQGKTVFYMMMTV